MAAVKREAVPAYSLEAEQAVLGALLIDPDIASPLFARAKEEDFVMGINQEIFRQARLLFRSGHAVDPVMIRDRIGGYSDYLRQLIEITPTAANWTEWVDVMQRQAAIHHVREIAAGLADVATLEECRSAVAEMEQLLSGGRQLTTWNAKEMLEDFFESQDATEPPEYISTGVREVDSGSYIKRGDVLVIGGEPSSGKTAFSLMMAHRMAQRYKVGFFSLETDREQFRDRALAYAMQLDFGSIQSRKLTESDWEAVAAKSADFSKRDLTVLEASGMTATDIQSVTQAYGFDVIFVDYVQLVKPEVGKNVIRSEQIADISRSLHTFAQKSKTLVVELAQLSRAERSGGWREPEMQDLKESGQLEQDADMIFLLYKADPKNETFGGDKQEKYRILKLAKNKKGPRGKWPMYFDGARQTFSTIIPQEEKSEPVNQVMRDLVETGKAAKARNKVKGQQVRGQQKIIELPPAEDRALPF